ncbi:thioredoxin-disulfide reductase [Leifsonia soli]|uniref:Thioredoxin reductase n=1 Tax=Leifsonia soli TaxID=582665 RepID=A0A852T3L4_9MICO|nr:thioredoxin-disulfide reductase [Leifsonia soli]NYD76109.1 thioredoxin reductase (NADPH) [Leifsonia soli]
MRQTIIIGSGPAGFTAAIYAARASLSPLLIASSVEAGGDLVNTTEVENFPGFPTGVLGPDLVQMLQAQAEKFGTEVLFEDVENLDLVGDSKRVTLSNGATHESESIIFATGSAYRKLGIPGEDRLTGHGVSWCATCDGFFFRGKTVGVVGGGDSAMQEAAFLARFADKVYIIHRTDNLRASRIMKDRALSNPKIELLVNKRVKAVRGEEAVTSVDLVNTHDGSPSTLELQGLFIAIGADPRTHLVHGKLDFNSDGTVAVDGRSSRTSLAGVFVAGDVLDATYRQAITAAGSGAVAALDAERYLAAR